MGYLELPGLRAGGRFSQAGSSAPRGITTAIWTLAETEPKALGGGKVYDKTMGWLMGWRW